MARRSVSDPATNYARAIVSGRRISCLTVKQACQRHLDDIDAGRFTWDPEASNRIADYLSIFRHYKGQWAGRNFVVEDWQRFVLGSIFGWKKPNGRRRYKHAYIEVPRKNGKTLLAAGVGLYMMAADGEAGAEVYSAATKKDQAKILWKDAKTMLEQCAEESFVRAFHTTRNPPLIECESTHSTFVPLSRESSNLDGLNPHCILADELHAWKDPDLWNVLNSALGSRAQPLFLQITTAGYVREGICRAQQRHVKSILNGTYEGENYFGFIASADDDDDETSERTWRKANPNWGVSVLVDGMRESYELAQSNPDLRLDWRVKRLNIWAAVAKEWLPMRHWKNCRREIELQELEGARCFAGLDLAQVRDLSALVLYFPPAGEIAEATIIPFFWCPEENIRERSKTDRLPYYTWTERGLIRATPGNVTDYRVIERDILEIAGRYKLEAIAFDRTFSGAIVQNLTESGIEMLQHGQGFRDMSAPSKELERLVVGEKVNHLGHPILTWMAEHCVTAIDAAGNIKPDKGKSEEKIDGISALVMAIGASLTEESESELLFEVW
jgi:phage terminase large subunit-like protein